MMIQSSSRRRPALAALLLMVPFFGTPAQVRAPTDTSQAQQTLFNVHDAWLAAGFAGLTVAMFPRDKPTATPPRRPDPAAPANRFFDRSAKGLELISTPGSFIMGGALYGFGIVADKPNF